MPIKVPTYESQVQAAPNPSLIVPGPTSPPPSAFGGQIAERIGQTGQVLGGIGNMLADHAIEENRRESTAQILDADTAFRKDLQTTLFSTDTDPEKDNQPIGLFNRTLGNAKGTTEEFDTRYGALRQKYLERFTNPVQQAEMAKAMDSNYSHHRESVIRHEAAQGRENKNNILEGNLHQLVSDAAYVSDPRAFLTQVQEGQARQFAHMKENGMDDASILAAHDKFTADMAKGALIPMIRSTPTEALAFLRDIEPTLGPKMASDMKRMIDVQARQMEQLEKYERNKIYDENMRASMLDMFDGKLTLSEAERRFREDTISESDYHLLEGKLVKPDYQILREMEVSDHEAFSEIRQAQLSGTKTPGELSRMIAKGNVDGKITSDDAKYLDKMSKDVPPSPRDQHVAAQAQSIEEFGKRYFADHISDYVNLPVVGDVQTNKKQAAKDVQGLMSEFYRRVDNEKADGERVGEIAKEVMGQYVKKRYPEVGRLSDIPHVVVGIDGKIQRLLRPTDKTKLKGQFKVLRNESVTDDASDLPSKKPAKKETE